MPAAPRSRRSPAPPRAPTTARSTSTSSSPARRRSTSAATSCSRPSTSSASSPPPRTGGRVLEARVFDGSDTGKKVYSTLTIIGPQRKGANGDSAVAAKLADVRALAVDRVLLQRGEQGFRARLHDVVRPLRERRLGLAEARLRRLQPLGEIEEARLAARRLLRAIDADFTHRLNASCIALS